MLAVFDGEVVTQPCRIFEPSCVEAVGEKLEAIELHSPSASVVGGSKGAPARIGEIDGVPSPSFAALVSTLSWSSGTSLAGPNLSQPMSWGFRVGKRTSLGCAVRLYCMSPSRTQPSPCISRKIWSRVCRGRMRSGLRISRSSNLQYLRPSNDVSRMDRREIVIRSGGTCTSSATRNRRYTS